MYSFIIGHGMLVRIGHKYSNLRAESKIAVRSEFQIFIISGGH